MKTAQFLKFDKSDSQNLALAALDYTTDFARKFKLEQILINFSVNVSETITITLDSALGANYDTVLQEVTLVAEKSLVYRPQGQANFQAGDELRIQCTNANGIGVAYCSLKSSEMWWIKTN